jgi:hypothetical protein
MPQGIGEQVRHRHAVDSTRCRDAAGVSDLLDSGRRTVVETDLEPPQRQVGGQRTADVAGSDDSDGL